eukprot:COSAG03_NODE_654_length_6434_cov_349.926283_3_plen_83_part_00
MFSPRSTTEPAVILAGAPPTANETGLFSCHSGTEPDASKDAQSVFSKQSCAHSSTFATVVLDSRAPAPTWALLASVPPTGHV